MELWELVARESIRDLVARYNANGDAGRFDQMTAVFAPDAVLEVVAADGTTRRFEGTAAIASLFAETKAGWEPPAAPASSNPAPGSSPRHHVRHFVATRQIDVDDPGHARGRSYFAVLLPHGLDHWGRYVDDYEVRDGLWRIVRRRALTDGHATGLERG